MKTDNEIIAEFMGYKEIDTINSTSRFKYYNKGSGPLMDSYFLERHAYSVSWDWLMPVVEKIDKMMPEIKIPEDLKTLEDGDHLANHYMEVVALPLSTHISEVYQAVVEFIKWYNNQQGK